MSLHLEHIKQKFGSTPVLNDINLGIRPSEFIAVLGPSGCGKTTLLRIIGGFLKPTSGTVRLDDTVYSDSSVMVPIENRDLGMVFQSFALWPHMTVREHVEFPLKSRKKADWPAAKRKPLSHRPFMIWGSMHWQTAIPGNFPAGSGSAYPWPGPSSASRPSCSWMNR